MAAFPKARTAVLPQVMVGSRTVGEAVTLDFYVEPVQALVGSFRPWEPPLSLPPPYRPTPSSKLESQMRWGCRTVLVRCWGLFAYLPSCRIRCVRGLMTLDVDIVAIFINILRLTRGKNVLSCFLLTHWC